MHDPAVLRSLHLARFQAEPAIYVAPGRVNLIGEHTDYAEGFVMPVAIDFATLAGISPRTDGKIVIYSENYTEEVTFDAAALPAVAAKHWSDYPIGVVVLLTGEGYKIPGFSLSLWGDVPLGSGLSSSAALEVVTMLAVTTLIGVSIPGPALARLCQRVENEFVGANCGIMDQFISANGKENHALLLDCRDLSFKLAPIPANIALVIANTMVKHSIAGGDYPTRRRESEAACAVIASHRPGVPFLRDATLEDLEKWGHEMEPKSLLRARHVISEDLRTVAAEKALENGDLKEVGRLMAEAHRSYSQDFEGSCVEADAMVELAQDIPGLIGARLTGGGFGGCTINLVEQSQAKAFAAELGKRYAAKFGIEPQIHICHASDGAHRLA
ncbi:MAG: galactokinase [Terracidiphilus sp.]|nr:galactokinase [Terracidiphilus sp.]MDR3776495.1 galactokinase [Terracidiphilus sp.]